MIESSVVLPDPEGPSSATTSPGATCIEIPRSTSTRCEPSSNTLYTPSTASTLLCMPPLTLSPRAGRGDSERQVRNTSAGSMPATRLNDNIAAPRHISTVPTKTLAAKAGEIITFR